MEIQNRTPSLREAVVNQHHFDNNTTKTSQMPMSSMVDSLKLDHRSDSRQTQMPMELYASLEGMSAQQRSQVIDSLKEIQKKATGTDLGQILDEKMPDVEREAHNGTGFDHLLDLLFSMLVTLGKGQSKRSEDAAKFAKISVEFVQQSCEKNILAANLNLGGAIGGLVLGGVTAAVGFAKNVQANSKQVDNLKENFKVAEDMKMNKVKIENELKRPNSPMTGASPQEQLKKIETRHGHAEVEPCEQHLTPAERAGFEKDLARHEVVIAEKEFAYKERQIEHGKEQAAAHAISGMTHQVGGMPATATATAAAGENAAAKANEAQGQVATSAQRSDEQQAQHLTEMLMKVFAQIASMTDQNRSTLDAISQGIKV